MEPTECPIASSSALAGDGAPAPAPANRNRNWAPVRRPVHASPAVASAAHPTHPTTARPVVPVGSHLAQEPLTASPGSGAAASCLRVTATARDRACSCQSRPGARDWSPAHARLRRAAAWGARRPPRLFAAHLFRMGPDCRNTEGEIPGRVAAAMAASMSRSRPRVMACRCARFATLVAWVFPRACPGCWGRVEQGGEGADEGGEAGHLGAGGGQPGEQGSLGVAEGAWPVSRSLTTRLGEGAAGQIRPCPG